MSVIRHPSNVWRKPPPTWHRILAGSETATQDQYEALIRYLLERNAPVDAIGLQGHFGEDFTPPEEMERRLNRFAAFGKPMGITEFDITTTDRQLQADALRDLMTLMFSQPLATHFIFWGFWDYSHWIPNCGLFTEDWQPKPAYDVYTHPVFKKWTTQEKGITDKDGRISLRGFHGRYLITATANGIMRSVRTELGKEGAVVELAIDPSLPSIESDSPPPDRK